MRYLKELKSEVKLSFAKLFKINDEGEILDQETNLYEWQQKDVESHRYHGYLVRYFNYINFKEEFLVIYGEDNKIFSFSEYFGNVTFESLRIKCLNLGIFYYITIESNVGHKKIIVRDKIISKLSSDYDPELDKNPLYLMIKRFGNKEKFEQYAQLLSRGIQTWDK